ncbi:helix-turn-helix domain-containing protein [Streptomyces sp. NPDC057689]|uniref:helix-turn-helix domain-containing protein n=1 Tax=Streptomyces sp. NPDC057689 TaxID=3346213 RepID=UPI003695F39A
MSEFGRDRGHRCPGPCTADSAAWRQLLEATKREGGAFAPIQPHVGPGPRSPLHPLVRHRDSGRRHVRPPLFRHPRRWWPRLRNPPRQDAGGHDPPQHRRRPGLRVRLASASGGRGRPERASARTGALLDASGIGLRALGDRAGVSHATISRLLRGMVLPDMGTLARLEVATGRDLWPGLHAWADRD